MSKKLKIYTAGPISGMSYLEAIKYFDAWGDILKEAGYIVYSPLTGKDHLRNELELRAEGIGNPISCNHAIFGRDRWMVDTVDVVVCNLITATERTSIGSMMELAWASDKNKHVVVIMGKENVHRHAFVLEAADVVFETEDEAIDYLKILNM